MRHIARRHFVPDRIKIPDHPPQFCTDPQRNPENRRIKYIECVPSRGPPINSHCQKDPSPKWGVPSGSPIAMGGSLSLSGPWRVSTGRPSSDLCLTVPATPQAAQVHQLRRLASKIHFNGVCRLRTAHIDGGQFTSSLGGPLKRFRLSRDRLSSGRFIGANAMRSFLALGLLITLCASASAAPARIQQSC